MTSFAHVSLHALQKEPKQAYITLNFWILQVKESDSPLWSWKYQISPTSCSISPVLKQHLSRDTYCIWEIILSLKKELSAFMKKESTYRFLWNKQHFSEMQRRHQSTKHPNSAYWKKKKNKNHIFWVNEEEKNHHCEDSWFKYGKLMLAWLWVVLGAHVLLVSLLGFFFIAWEKQLWKLINESLASHAMH